MLNGIPNWHRTCLNALQDRKNTLHETRVAMDSLVRNMVRQLNVALVNTKVYAVNHPTTQNAIQRSYKALEGLLQEKGETALGTVENTLVVDGSPLEPSDSILTRCIEELKNRDIEGLVFYSGISPEEFKDFLICMSTDPERLAAEGGASSFFEKQGLRHVLVNEVRYGKIREDGLADGQGLEEAIIAAFLMGKTPAFRGNRENFLGLLRDQPSKIGEMINKGLCEMRENGKSEAELVRAANRAVEQVIHFLDAQPGGAKQYTDLMSRLVLAMDPEVQAGLYKSRVSHEEKRQDKLDALVMEFADEEVIRLICNVYLGGLRSTEMLARIARRILPTQERRVAIAADLGRALVEAGMEEGAWINLRDEILWNCYSLSQKIDRLTSRAQLDKSGVERIREIGPDLARRKDTEQIRGLLKGLLRALEDQDSGVRHAAAVYLSEFYGIVRQSGKFQRADLFFCQKLIARLNRETEEGVSSSILASLGDILQDDILDDRFQAPARAVLTLSKMGYLLKLTEMAPSLVAQDVTDRVISAASREDGRLRDEASILLKLFGRAVLGSVLFALEREDSPETRKRLMVVVKSMGAEIVGEIIHRLADSRWYVVQTALSVLGEIGDKTVAPDLLMSSVYHHDIRVRKEAIKTLGKLRTPGALRMLRDLLKDKEDEIQILALKTLGDVGDKLAVSHIQALLEKRRLRGPKCEILRQSAIQALGRIGSSEAIPTLLDVLRSKVALKKGGVSIRKSTVEALGAMGEPELEEVLLGVIERDEDLGVRETARRAILNLRPSEARIAV